MSTLQSRQKALLFLRHATLLLMSVARAMVRAGACATESSFHAVISSRPQALTRTAHERGVAKRRPGDGDWIWPDQSGK